MWLEQYVMRGDYGFIQDRFANLYISLGGPREMLLAVANTEDETRQRIIALVKDESMAKLFPELQKLQGPLPKKVVFLVGNQDEILDNFKLDVISDDEPAVRDISSRSS